MYVLPFFSAAASCIQPLNSSVRIVLENIRVEFGIAGEKTFKSLDTQRRVFDISAILIDGGWGLNGLEYFHDFAMLKLDNEIETFSDILRPVCLENNKMIFDIKLGRINGFSGTNLTIVEDSYSDDSYNVNINETTDNYDKGILSQKNPLVVIADNDEPRKMEPVDELTQLAQLKWKESFIAGAEISGICPANVGSGFYVDLGGKLNIKGIVSAAGRGEKYDCHQSSYAIFSDVLQYIVPVNYEQDEDDILVEDVEDSADHHSYESPLIKFSKAKLLKREPVCR